MNINTVNRSLAPTFKCNCPDCENKVQSNNVPAMKNNHTDTVELSKKDKALNFAKKSVKYLKDNRKQISTVGLAVLNGTLNACTVLGANVLMNKVAKADTSKLAFKLAAIVGLTTCGADLIKNRKSLKNNN